MAQGPRRLLLSAWRSAPTGRASSPPRTTAPRGCGTLAPGHELLELKGHARLGWQRRVQPRRGAHRHRIRGRHRAGVGRRHAAQLLRELKGHDGTVFSAAFSADGTRIVTASDDGTAAVWDASWGITVRREELVRRVCAEKLVGDKTSPPKTHQTRSSPDSLAPTPASARPALVRILAPRRRTAVVRSAHNRGVTAAVIRVTCAHPHQCPLDLRLRTNQCTAANCRSVPGADMTGGECAR